MNNITKSIIGIMIIILAGIVLVYGTHDKGESSKPTVKIGVTLPLTGNIARLGQSTKNAIELAYANLPENTKYNYELVIEDDQFKPIVGASTASKLINVDKVSALISFGSPVGSAVSPI